MGFFPYGTTGGACSQNNSSVYPKQGVTMKGGKQGSRVYLLGLLVHKVLSLLFLTALGFGCHLLRSGIPSFKDRQNQTKRLTNIEATNTFRKILKDQKARRGKEEPIQRFPVTRLALPPLRALHRFYSLSHKFGDGSGLIILPYVELEVADRLSLFICGFPEGSGKFPQPDSRRIKRKSYFQYFTFDFFSMAVMKPGLLLKQYHPKSLVSLGALWTVCTRLNARAVQLVLVQNLFNYPVKREPETVVESRAINCYTFGGRLIHGCIRLRDYESTPCTQEWAGAPWNFDPSATISGTDPSVDRPLFLRTDLSRLVDAFSEDEHLDDTSEAEEDVSPEEELVLVEATSAADFGGLGAEQGLPWMPSANNLSGLLMRGVGFVLAIRRTWKSFMTSALVISQGYDTYPLGLSILGVNEYSQLDHEGLPGSKWGTA
ncbi:hypothetical protein Cgig2_027418 [Carnegiea gigantea]|uniref:Uncharacterized protein n=1 Tax=Carnegiea gigantea TaxID=171969 RepID=A0A9Q1JNL7_9CARY|nr:hypothetical protein Cgig2_027418 [Carnegiea gigantea]